MCYILGGGNLAQAFEDLYIPKDEAELVFESEDKDYQLWRVSKNTVNILYSVPNNKWSSRRWGWWIYSKQAITTYPVGLVKIRNTHIKAWLNPKRPQREFSSLRSYCEEMWGKSSDSNFMNIITNLAILNDCDVLKLVKRCDE